MRRGFLVAKGRGFSPQFGWRSVSRIHGSGYRVTALAHISADEDVTAGFRRTRGFPEKCLGVIIEGNKVIRQTPARKRMCGRCSSHSLEAPTVALSVTLGAILLRKSTCQDSAYVTVQDRFRSYGDTRFVSVGAASFTAPPRFIMDRHSLRQSYVFPLVIVLDLWYKAKSFYHLYTWQTFSMAPQARPAPWGLVERASRLGRVFARREFGLINIYSVHNVGMLRSSVLSHTYCKR